MINSTLASNSAGAEGGAITNDSGSIVNLVNDTVWNNLSYNQVLQPINLTIPQTSGGGGGCGDSGCIYAIAPHLGGGGIDNGGTLNLKNSVLAQNTDIEPETQQTIPDNISGFGTVNRSGSNLETDTTAAAGLDTALKNNGGPTQTLALLAGSPAINAISLANCTDLNGSRVSTDQRGVPRPQSTNCDIGAYEYFASRYPLPAVAVYAIYDQVQTMPVSSSVKKDLDSPLLAAVASLNQGSTKTAKNQLSAFINQVNSLVYDSLLTPTQGSTLTTPAQAVIRSLSSGT